MLLCKIAGVQIKLKSYQTCILLTAYVVYIIVAKELMHVKTPRKKSSNQLCFQLVFLKFNTKRKHKKSSTTAN